MPGAYRHWTSPKRIEQQQEVSMHLLVPGAYRRRPTDQWRRPLGVSMHLLVPGTYRLAGFGEVHRDGRMPQCTFWCRVLTDARRFAGTPASCPSLNAPSGAGCLPTVQAGVQYELTTVSSQCTFWCRVLTDYNMKEVLEWVERLSQCTFWCRVLTDWKWSMSARLLTGLNAPSGAGCLPTQEGVNDGQG